MHLERSHIRCFRDLAESFIKQYKYNEDMPPDRMQLQSLRKKNQESFKEYAQRWRELAAQVAPPLSEKEITTMFIDTLQSPFYEMMIGSVSLNFSDMVIIGERVESGLLTGKIPESPSVVMGPRRSSMPKKGEAQAVMTEPRGYHSRGPYQTPYQQAPYRPYHYPYVAATSPAPYPQTPRPITPQIRPPHPNTSLPQRPFQPWAQNPNPNTNYPRPPQERKPVHFDPIPMSYTQLLPQLISGSLLLPVPMKPVEPPYPRGYDPNAKCDYHAGAIGHSTENCRALKFKVQDLIDAKWLSFQDATPNVGNNPLPYHGGSGVNMVEPSQGTCKVENIGAVRTPLSFIFHHMCKLGWIQRMSDQGGNEEGCQFHGNEGHSIEECGEFKELVQHLMNANMIQISHHSGKAEIDMINNSQPSPFVPKPVVNQRRDCASPIKSCAPRHSKAPSILL